jgi:hypothetical protein
MGVLIAEWIMIVMGFLIDCALILGILLLIINIIEKLRDFIMKGW